MTLFVREQIFQPLNLPMSISKSGSQPVHMERKAGVLQLTIDVPALRNSMAAPGVLEGLLAGLDELENDKELHCAVLTGAGGAFVRAATCGSSLTAPRLKHGPACRPTHRFTAVLPCRKSC
ncbi:hypothetical protein LP417_34935 (plasmid) [Polaromonas sp. P1-6]|nr:hypothetical protein LP417_34935 [Polaromonas sp. P1-6]